MRYKNMKETENILQQLKIVKKILTGMMDLYTQTDDLRNSTINKITNIDEIINNGSCDINFIKNKIMEYFNVNLNNDGWYNEIIKECSKYDFIMEKK